MAAGTNTFKVIATDAAGVTASKELTLAIGDGGAEEGATTTGVPYAWLDGYGLGDGTAAGYEAAANAKAANGRKVWECYVAGLDPTKEKNFTAVLSFDENGKPVIESVSPDLGAERNYTLQGKKDLMDEEWDDVTDIPDPGAEGYHFFCVGVSLRGE